MAEGTESFFISLKQSLSPTGYKKLRYGEPWRAFVYVVVLLFFGLLIKAIFLMPLAIDVAGSLENVSSKLVKASFEGAIETKEPILIPEKRPLVQIDTAANAIRKGSVFITQKSITFGDKERPTVIPFPDLSQSADNKEFYTGMLIVAVFAAPSIILLLFAGGLIKVMLLAFVMGCIGFAVNMVRGSSSGWARSLAMACYSLTAMVLVESILVPLRLGEFLFPLFAVVGITFYAVSISISLCIFFIWLVLSGSEKYAFG
jgi:hypothetical protein